ncbi:MAG: NAD-dependent epimerase/dehydratase family protein [Cetobacterium sp.]
MNKILIEDFEYILNQKLEWGNFSGKNILITGANGILASYMVMSLLYLNKKFSKKCKVFALVRNIEKAKRKFIEFLNDENLILIQQDVCSEILIEDELHYIVHAASQASPKYYLVDPVGTLNANVIGTNNLLKLSYDKKVESFLFFSTGEVYGEVKENQIPTKEIDYGYIDPTNIRACYSESKRMGETMCVSWYSQYKVPAKIVRPFHTYGPGIELDDGRVFSDFINDILNNRNIQMKSDGKAIRAFCYLSDATIAFFNILLNGKNGEAYNVGNPNEEISILELAKTLVNLFPEKKIKVIEKSHENKNYLASNITKNSPSIDKIKKIGWEPKITIKEGFKRTVESYL